MAQTNTRRCDQHGLAVAPDGLCVLCRRHAAPASVARDAANSAAPRSLSAPASAGPQGRSKQGAIGALLLLMAAGAAAALKLDLLGARRGAPSARVSAEPPLARDAQPQPDTQRALDQAKARDLADALQKLEQAESERLLREQQRVSEDAARRGAIEAARKQEEQARDEARHEAVMRDLEQQGLADARRRVQITMYSTDWCGACKKARSYMRAQNITFTELDVERDAEARQRAHALNPRGSVPTIAVDRELLIGFSAQALEDRITRAARQRKL